jgi:hypothetical protein
LGLPLLYSGALAELTALFVSADFQGFLGFRRQILFFLGAEVLRHVLVSWQEEPEERAAEAEERKGRFLPRRLLT